MDERERSARTNCHLSSHSSSEEPTQEELLDIYLSLSKEHREQRFASTSHVAEMLGLAQRTIQTWVDTGSIRAVRVGKKYQVDLHSLRARLIRYLAG